jgi:glycosyltransferase involved in cell wall biosynthesis
MIDLPRLRIVIAMLEPPLPFGNAAARWYYVLLRGLAARGHRVTAYAACSAAADMEAARDLFPQPAYDLRCHAFPQRRGLGAKFETWRRPYSYMFGPGLKRDLAATLAGGFDVLHLEQLWCGWLGLGHRDRALLNVHHLVAIDLEDARPTTWHGRWARRAAAATERRLIRAFRHVRSCSPRLVPVIRRWNPVAEVTTVPVGIDPGQYEYIPDSRRPAEPVISLIGSMSWHPGHSAAVRLLTRLWPAIRRRVPAARVQIVGWKARSALRDFLSEPGVAIEENVPDIRPYFERTGVLLYAPARGSGMKIKVLEALAFGVPVVTTSEGVEGLPAEDGVHAGVCDDDDGLVERAVRVLTDPRAQNRQRAAGRQLVERHCGPEATLDGIEAIYGGMMGRRAEPRPALAGT